MYKVVLPLSGYDDTIVRPVALYVEEAIRKAMRLGEIKTINTTDDITDNDVEKGINNRNSDYNNIRKEVLYIDYENIILDNQIGTLRLLNSPFRRIMYDKKTDIEVKPIYSKAELVLNLNYKAQSKSKVNSVLNSLKLYYNTIGGVWQAGVNYSYKLPDQLVLFMDHVVDLKNRKTDGGLTLEQYIEETFDNRIDFTNTTDGNTDKVFLHIRESQLLGYIMIDDIGDIKPVYDSNTSQWGIEFTVKFKYDMPLNLVVKYPFLINNSVIDKKYRLSTNREVDERYHPCDGNLYKANASLLPKLYKGDKYVKIPSIDDVNLPEPVIYINRLFSIMLVVDPDNPYELLRFSELPGIKLNDKVLEFLIRENKYFSNVHQSLFFIDYHSGNKAMNNGLLYIEEIVDSDGNIIDYTLKTKEKMSVENVYRMTFNVVNNIEVLTHNYKRILKVMDEIDGLYKTDEDFYKIYLSIFDIDLTNNEDLTNEEIGLVLAKYHKQIKTKMIHSIIASVLVPK